MPAAERRALDAVLPTNGGGPGRAGADAPDGRNLYEVAILRIAADCGGAAPRRFERKPQARAPADACDGTGGDLPEAQHQQGPPGSQGLPISVAGIVDRPAEPGL